MWGDLATSRIEELDPESSADGRQSLAWLGGSKTEGSVRRREVEL